MLQGDPGRGQTSDIAPSRQLKLRDFFEMQCGRYLLIRRRTSNRGMLRRTQRVPTAIHYLPCCVHYFDSIHHSFQERGFATRPRTPRGDHLCWWDRCWNPVTGHTLGNSQQPCDKAVIYQKKIEHRRVKMLPSSWSRVVAKNRP